MPKQVMCPQCKDKVDWQGNTFRPFCSEKCKLLDLGDWAKEKFRVPLHEFDPQMKDDEDSEF